MKYLAHLQDSAARYNTGRTAGGDPAPTSKRTRGGDELQQPGDGAPAVDVPVTGSGATKEGQAWRRDARGMVVADGGRLVVTGQGSSSGRRSLSLIGQRRAALLGHG